MKKALIVDDNEQNLYLLQIMLEGKGYDVMTAGNGVEALEKAKSTPPDIIISDILMPVMDGFALCREWNKDEQLQDIPFVFYTATYTDPKDEELGLSLGAARFVVKPTDMETLVDLLQQIIKEYKAGPPVTHTQTTPEETDYYKLYNKALVRKLEDKVIDLEQCNLKLEQEITYHKVVKEELQRSESHYGALVENIPDVIASFDRDCRYQFINSAISQVSKAKPEDFIGKVLGDIEGFTEEQIAFRKQVVQNVFQTRTPFEGEFEFHRPNGNLAFEWRVYPVLDAEGNVLSVFSINRNVTPRKRAEDALRESEGKFRTLFDSANDAIFIVKDNLFVDCNPKALEMYRCGKEDIIGHSPVGFSPEFQPEGVSSSEKAIEKIDMALKGVPQFFDWKHIRRDGTSFDAEVSLNSFELGGDTYLQAIVRDVSERKQAEEALRKSEQRLQAIMDASPVAIAWADVDDNVLYINHKFQQLFGYTLEEIPTMAAWRRLAYPDPAYRERRVSVYSLCKEGKEFAPDEATITCKNGSQRHVMVSGTAVSNTMLFMLSDITERKQAEDRLALSEQQLKAILQASPVGIGRTKERAYEWVNETMCHITGYSPEEFQGRNARFLYENETEYERVGKILYEEGEVETRWVRKDGKVRDISLQITQTSSYAYIFTAMDITEHKATENQLRQAQKMEAIGTLTGGIAHDFNNILTVISGFGTLLRMTLGKADPLHNYVDQILSSSEKAANLTRSLLAFSRQQPIKLAPTSLNNTIKGTEKLLKRLLTEDIELTTSLISEDVIIMADATQIDQILFNLATNARDAMKNGGTLAIETKTFQMDNEFKELHGFGDPGRYALMTVSDTGCGIDESTQERIFDPFFTTKEIGKGTGLGLATVYGIVKQHNGYIDVSSELNMGTTFSVYLPALETAAEKAVEEERTFFPASKGTNETILVAEDDADLRLLLKKTLARYGYAVIEATDGQDAIRRFKEHGNIDLMILDSVMPRKNGREAYDEIRRTKPLVKVLFMSGYTKDIVLDKGVEEGKVDFVTKPLQLNILLQKVREVLDRQ